MQEVQLDKKVKLLDCPGLVMAGGNRTDASVALRNAVKVETLDDPITPSVAILARVPRQHLMLQYKITQFKVKTIYFIFKTLLKLFLIYLTFTLNRIEEEIFLTTGQVRELSLQLLCSLV